MCQEGLCVCLTASAQLVLCCSLLFTVCMWGLVPLFYNISLEVQVFRGTEATLCADYDQQDFVGVWSRDGCESQAGRRRHLRGHHFIQAQCNSDLRSATLHHTPALLLCRDCSALREL